GDAPELPGGRMVAVPNARAHLYYGGVDVTTNETPYSLVRFDEAPGALAFSKVQVAKAKATGDYLPALIYDAPRNRYIAACGANAIAGYHCNVTAYHPDTTEWETLTPAGDDKPKGRDGFFYAHDEENQRLVLFSGDMGGQGWDCACAQDTWALELAE